MDSIQQRQQQVLCDKKWHKLNRRTWLFRWIPFVEFVFGSGSLAIGNVDAESDFDMLVGVRSGRIFTARFFSVVTFGLLGWRRSKAHGNTEAADKICLNHFVTPESYTLRLKPNGYWRLLYQSIVPIYGTPRRIQQFYDANAALIGDRKVEEDGRYKHRGEFNIKSVFEILLRGWVGDWVEERLKKYQIKRIEAGLRVEKKGEIHRMSITGTGEEARVELEPLIVYSDEELEFHPDPAVIELSK